MKTVHKIIVYAPNFSVYLHKNARFLSAQLQKDIPVMWFEVDTDEPLTERFFEAIGTGWDIPDGRHWLGTYQSPDQNLVWHLYEVLQ